MMNIGIGELGLLLAILLLVFGAKKLPELAKSLGESLRIFQKAKDGEKSEENKGEQTEEIKNEELKK